MSPDPAELDPAEKELDMSRIDKNIEITEINDYINVYIHDNGVGFSKENIKNITKPYYTTKIKGTGLGLPIVTKIINRYLLT